MPAFCCPSNADGPHSKGEAFESGNWKWQMRMMDAMLTALERSLIGFT
jgi:hypothetical protein